MANEIDWSNYKVKDDDASGNIDWSQYAAQNIDESEERFAPEEKTGLLNASSNLISVGSDMIQGLAGALKKGNQFINDAPENLEKSRQYERENPVGSFFHNVGQVGAEAADIGKEIINAPYNLNQYLARKHLLPEIIGKIGKYTIPRIPEGAEKALGLEADPGKGDSLVRALTDAAALGQGSIKGKKVGSQFKEFVNPDLKKSIKQTQNKVNEASSKTGKIFDAVEKEVGEKGLSKIPIDMDIIDQAQNYLARTNANKKLIERAHTGDYKALRQLQADLRVKGEKALSSQLAAENTMGEEILAAREEINTAIQSHLENTGYKDLANKLNNARGNYADIQKTYFSTPQLAKVFGKSQKVPKNPATLLAEDSVEMNRFMKAHPEIEKALKKSLKYNTKKKIAKGLGKVGAISIGVEEANRLLGK